MIIITKNKNQKKQPTKVTIVSRKHYPGKHNQASHGNWSKIGTDDVYEKDGDRGGPTTKPIETSTQNQPKHKKRSEAPEWATKMADEAFRDLEEKGYELPENVIWDTPFKRSDFPPGLLGAALYKLMNNQAVAAYRTDEKDSIYINTNNAYWDSQSEAKLAQEEMFEYGWWSSANPKHPIYHEMGHKLHDANIDNFVEVATSELTEEEEQIIGNQVSLYGTLDPAEAVAEVFAGHMDGIVYSDEVYEIYNKYGGPELL